LTDYCSRELNFVNESASVAASLFFLDASATAFFAHAAALS
jgi:hypothetical protein